METIVNQITSDYSINVIELSVRQMQQLFFDGSKILFGQNVCCLLVSIVSKFYKVVEICPVTNLRFKKLESTKDYHGTFLADFNSFVFIFDHD
jgi:hypothetical protein